LIPPTRLAVTLAYDSGWPLPDLRDAADTLTRSRDQQPSTALSPFLIGRMFLREPSWKYSAKLAASELGQLFFANLVGSIRRSYIRVQKASLNMFWEHSPYWTIIASDWLRAELSCE